MTRNPSARLAAAALALLTVAGGSGPAAGASAAPSPPPVVSVTPLGTVRQHPAVYGRDGTFSALVNGRSVWSFGDTPMAVPGAAGDHWVDNSMAWTADLDASDGITLEGNRLDATGAPAEFLPLTAAERRYNDAHDGDDCSADPCGAEFALWAGPVVPDPARNRVLHLYTEIWRVPGREGWKAVGGGIAVQGPTGKVTRPVQDPSSPTPTLMWTGDDVQFNSAWVVVGPTLYAYGCESGFLVMHCKVGRVPLARALEEPRWRYYAGGGAWTATVRDAVNVFDGGAAGSTVFWVPYLRAYLAVYSGVFSDDVFYRISATPWGPWSAQTFLFRGQPGWNGNTLYAAQAHPEFAERSGRVQYVTYVRTTGFLRQELPLVRVVFG